jgi:glutamate synthase domain-containing protein 3
MRGGSIYVKGNAGYRAGIHMKAYQDKVPHLVIGGVAGSFLGEYQAGGVIVVLGLGCDRPIVGNFPCTGMHGGKVLLRSDLAGVILPKGVHAQPFEIMGSEFESVIRTWCRLFGEDESATLGGAFTLITPDSSNPYKQMYVQN